MLIMYTHIYLSGIIQGNKTTNNQVILYRSKSNNDKHILNEYLSFDGRAYHYQDDIYTRFKLELLVLSDNSSNGQITDLMELLTEQMKNTNDDFTDMRKVFGFMTPKNGLQLYFVDGTGYL